MSMSVRQRLTVRFQNREAQRICWHCALGQRSITNFSRVPLLRIGNERLDGFAALTRDIGQRIQCKDARLDALCQRRPRKSQISTRHSRVIRNGAKEQELESKSKARYHGSRKQMRVARRDYALEAVNGNSEVKANEAPVFPDCPPQANKETASCVDPRRARHDDMIPKAQTLFTEEDVSKYDAGTRTARPSLMQERSQTASVQNVSTLHSINIRPWVSFRGSTRAYRFSNAKSPRHTPGARTRSRSHSLEQIFSPSEAFQKRTKKSIEVDCSLRVQAMQAHSTARGRRTEERPIKLRKHIVRSKRVIYRTFPALRGSQPPDNNPNTEPDEDDSRPHEEVSISQMNEASLPSYSPSTTSKASYEPSHVDNVLNAGLDSMLDTYRNLASLRIERSTTSSPTLPDKQRRSQASSLRRAASLYYRNTPLTRASGSIRSYGNVSILKSSRCFASTSVSGLRLCS